MINLKEIERNNFDECMALERKNAKFVGDASYVLAEAYTFKDHSKAYGIYDDDIIVGMVIISDGPLRNGAYSFTDLFIADNQQGKGYAKEVVASILEKFKKERKAGNVSVCVHEANTIALHIYKKYGFKETKIADANNGFIELSLDL